jgi:TolB protein
MNLLSLFTIAVSLLPAISSFAADTIVITDTARAQVFPIAIKGYTGEADRVLKFDLEIQGFRVAEEADAQYILTGKTEGGQVEGRLTDKFNKSTLLAKAYSGGTTRTQAHALADEIIQLVTQKPGISRTKIVYKGDAGSSSEIFISDYDGYNPTQVTSDKTIVAAPAFVPKKWGLFYTSYKSGYPDIYSHDLTTGERRIIAKYPGLNTSATISPDGSRVAMILSKGGSPDLYVCNVDGSNLVQLTKTKEDESSPTWSADGTKICFASRVDERRALYVIPSTGGAMSRLQTGGVLNPSEPDWSPDGRTIAFTSQMGGFNICTVPASGGTAETLCAGEDPSWAPNSRTIIFTKRVGSKRTLSLLDVPTRKVKDTAQNVGSRSQPSWAK